MKNKIVLKKVLSLIKPYRFFVALSIIGSFLSVSVSLYIPFVTGQVIDNMVKEGRVFYNGVVNGIGAVKRDVKKGADNVKDSSMDGTLDTEDATHGIEYGSDMGGNSESESRMPITHRERIPSGK